MKIAVDFDGTVVDHRYPDVGPEAPHAVKALKILQREGHQIILNTMRSGKHLTDAIRWFIERDIELYGINKEPNQFRWTTSPKVFANCYIDDLALGCPMTHPEGFNKRCVDWLAVLAELAPDWWKE